MTKFLPADAFQKDLRARVEAYFQITGRRRRDLGAMYRKTAVLLSWLVASYLWLLLGASSAIGMILGCASLGLAMAGIGFAVQHDGSHGGYSDRGQVNHAMAWTLDLLGGSSYVWKWKHNVFHHTQPNVIGYDSDVDIEPLGRFTPAQPRRSFHRYQHVYMWFLYGLLPIKWHLIDDFIALATGKVGQKSLPPLKAKTLAGVLLGKALFFSWAFVLPALMHSGWLVAAAYAMTCFVCGVTLSVTFQLAHCIEEAEFPAGAETDWARHQVRTTVDFAPKSASLGWYLGGLNFQVVHHLFPTVCHLHYPAIAQIVAQTCAEHGEVYRTHRTLRGALRSHVRHLKKMGKPDVLSVA